MCECVCARVYVQGLEAKLEAMQRQLDRKAVRVLCVCVCVCVLCVVCVCCVCVCDECRVYVRVIDRYIDR